MFIPACVMAFGHGRHLALTTSSQTRPSGWTPGNTVVEWTIIFDNFWSSSGGDISTKWYIGVLIQTIAI